MAMKHKILLIAATVLVSIVAASAVCIMFHRENIHNLKERMAATARDAAIELHYNRMPHHEITKNLQENGCTFLVIARLSNNQYEPIPGAELPEKNSFDINDETNIKFSRGEVLAEFSTPETINKNLLGIIVPLRKFKGDRAFCFIGAPRLQPDYLKYLHVFVLCLLPALLTLICFLLFRPCAAKCKITAEPGHPQVNSDQLLQLGRLSALRQVTSGIIHELNQPLCVIKGYLGLMQLMWTPDEEDDDDDDDKPSPEEQEKKRLENMESCLKYIDLCLTNVDRAGHILDHIRKFVRDNSNDKSPVDPLKAIKNVMDFFGEQFSKRNIKLKLKLPEKISPLMICPAMLEQALVNLLANARDSFAGESYKGYESGGKSVVFSLEEVNDKVVFSIEDNGAGMDAEVLKRCTIPFFSTNQDNCGVGLPMTELIVKESGGELKINSIKGRGTSISMALPAKTIESEHKNGTA